MFIITELTALQCIDVSGDSGGLKVSRVALYDLVQQTGFHGMLTKRKIVIFMLTSNFIFRSIL